MPDYERLNRLEARLDWRDLDKVRNFLIEVIEDDAWSESRAEETYMSMLIYHKNATVQRVFKELDTLVQRHKVGT